MWLGKCGIPTVGEQQDTEEPYFIPSACWRKIALGILSTTRFARMLLAYGKQYASYDIGDGKIEWKVRAEASLFFCMLYKFTTKAHRMILICQGGKRNEIAKRIIRQTMWGRKSLLKDHYAETEKPVRYSKAPIRLRTQYEHVYLTTPALFSTSLDRIYREENIIENTIGEGERNYVPKEGDWEDWPQRYFLNPAFDILKLVFFFSAVKELRCLLEDELVTYARDLRYTLVVQPEDVEVAQMYPDVCNMKEVTLLVYRPLEDTEDD